MSPATSNRNWPAELDATCRSLLASVAIVGLLSTACAKKAPPVANPPLDLSKRIADAPKEGQAVAAEADASTNRSANNGTGNGEEERKTQKSGGDATSADSKPGETASASKPQSATEQDVDSGTQASASENSSESGSGPPTIEGRVEFRPKMPLAKAKGVAAEKLSQAKRAIASGDLDAAAVAASAAFNAATGYSAVDAECGRIAQAAEDLLGRAAARQSPAQDVPTVFE